MNALLALLLGTALPAVAQVRVAAPEAVPFVPAYLGSISLSLGQDPFFASRLLGAFHAELAAAAAAPTPRLAAEGLAARIGGPERLALPVVAVALGKSPVAPERAAAVLAANALARPDQFKEVVSGLEDVKPGLGSRVVEALRDAPARGGHPAVLSRLRELGRKVVPEVQGATYDATGALRRFFDGR